MYRESESFFINISETNEYSKLKKGERKIYILYISLFFPLETSIHFDSWIIPLCSDAGNISKAIRLLWLYSYKIT